MSYEALRYDQVRQKSAHNGFQQHEGIYDQIVYWRIRSLEMDLHRAKLGHATLKGDWAPAKWPEFETILRTYLGTRSPHVRLAEHHRLLIQYRVAPGGTTVAKEKFLGGGVIAEDTLVFVRLRLTKGLFGVPGGHERPPFTRGQLIGPRSEGYGGGGDWVGSERWEVGPFG